MIYHFTLSEVAVVLGIVSIFSHLFCLWKYEFTKNYFLKIHRHYPTGIILFFFAVLWFVWILSTIDLMEYTPNRQTFIWVVVVLAGLFAAFCKDYLATRAWGMMLLLAAQILLDAAFLREETSRLIIVVIAYLWIIFGIIAIGFPYMFRDIYAKYYKNERFAKNGLWLGTGFGVFILFLGWFVY